MFARSTLMGLALVLGSATPGAAEGLQPDAGATVHRIALGALAKEEQSGPALVFANDGGSSRVIFGRRGSGVACQADGDGAQRSRPGQYTLAPNAELRCTAQPGRYSFQVLRASGNGVAKSSSRLVVR